MFYDKNCRIFEFSLCLKLEKINNGRGNACEGSDFGKSKGQRGLKSFPSSATDHIDCHYWNAAETAEQPDLVIVLGEDGS